MTLTTKQKKLRLTGVTASEIAAVVGIDPYKTAFDVWHGKVEPNFKDEPTEAMKRGIFLEAGVVQWYMDRTGYKVTSPGTIRHPFYDYILATPDGFVYIDDDTDNRCLEVKCPGEHTWHHWVHPDVQPDGIPAYYLPQVTFVAATMGVSSVDVAALIRGELWIYNIKYNAKLFGYLASKALMFIELVKSKTPPELDHSKSAKIYVESAAPKVEQEELLTSDTDLEHIILDLQEAKVGLKEDKERVESLENKVKLVIGSAPGIKGPWGHITWKENKNGKRVFRCNFEG